jgi:phosphoenolpyruvate carboxykinase (GTP)
MQPTVQAEPRPTLSDGQSSRHLTVAFPDYVAHKRARAWIQEVVDLTKPDRVVFADGSQEEYDRLCDELVAAGTFIRLNEEKHPNSFAAFSDPSDVARVEDRTYICSRARRTPARRTTGCPRGDEETLLDAVRREHARADPLRHPVLDGPHRLPHLPDRHRAHRLRLRRGQHADHDADRAGRVDALGEDGDFVPCLHTVGAPLAEGSGGRAVAVQPRR